MARPSMAAQWLTDDGLLTIKGWARDGLTDKKIAGNIGVRADTFCTWKKDYPQFSKALKEGRVPADVTVEDALYLSAIGHYKTVRKPIKVKTEKQLQGKGKIVEEHIEYVEEQLYFQPNVAAQIFWLKNRKSAKWRDKPIESGDMETSNEQMMGIANLINTPVPDIDIRDITATSDESGAADE